MEAVLVQVEHVYERGGSERSASEEKGSEEVNFVSSSFLTVWMKMLGMKCEPCCLVSSRR
ncbi:hypothetical protein PAMP_021491 [Pampus punctatissimus]